MKLYLFFAVLTFGLQAQARTITCDGVIYNKSSALMTKPLSPYDQWNLQADLFAVIDKDVRRDTVTPGVIHAVLMDLQQISESESGNSVVLKYVWCPAAIKGTPACGNAVRTLKIDKTTTRAEFFNGQPDGTEILVSQGIVCTEL